MGPLQHVLGVRQGVRRSQQGAGDLGECGQQLPGPHGRLAGLPSCGFARRARLLGGEEDPVARGAGQDPMPARRSRAEQSRWTTRATGDLSGVVGDEGRPIVSLRATGAGAVASECPEVGGVEPHTRTGGTRARDNAPHGFPGHLCRTDGAPTHWLRRLSAGAWTAARHPSLAPARLPEDEHLPRRPRPKAVALHVEIVGGLEIEPEPLRGAEEPGQAQGGVGRDRPLPVDDLVDAAGGHAQAATGCGRPRRSGRRRAMATARRPRSACQRSQSC